MRKRSSVDVMGQIHVGTPHPLRRAEIEDVCAEHLPEPWDLEDPLGNALPERVVIGHRSVNDRDPTDGEADMLVGSSASRKPASSVERCSSTRLCATGSTGGERRRSPAPGHQLPDLFPTAGTTIKA